MKTVLLAMAAYTCAFAIYALFGISVLAWTAAGLIIASTLVSVSCRCRTDFQN